MILKARFLYNDAASEGAGGTGSNNGGGQEQVAASTQGTGTEAQATATATLPEDVQKQLTEFNERKAEFEEWKKAQAEKDTRTPEQIAKEKEIDQANFRKYAIENDLAKDDDFVKFETLQQKKDADLVFENFLQDFKEENPDLTDEKEIAEAARKEFETTYRLNSTNEKSKEKGLAKLAKEAGEIRNPFSSKISTAKEKYEGEKELAATYSTKYVPFTEEVKKEIPAKLTYSKLKVGDEDVVVEVDVTPEDVKEIEEKFLKKHKTYYQFKQGKPDEVKTKLLEKIQSFLLVKKREEGNQKLAEKFEGIGVAKGSNVGAENLYSMGKNNQQALVVDLKQNHAANAAREKYAKAR